MNNKIVDRRTAPQSQRMGRPVASRFAVLRLAIALTTATCLTGCPAAQPNEDRPNRFAVVMTNTSQNLVSALLAVRPNSRETLVYSVPVAPMSWESLILDCDVDEFLAVGVLISDPSNPDDTQEITLTEPPFINGEEFGCGSAFSFEIAPDTRPGATRPITTRVRTIPLIEEDVTASDAGFVLIEASFVRNVPARLNFTWQGNDSNQFESSINFGGSETLFGFLLNCPVQQFALGSFTDDDLPGAELLDLETEFPAPPPLTEDMFACGDAINIAITTDGDQFALSLDTSSEQTENFAKTLVTIRQFLDEKGLYDSPSSVLSLLPPSTISEEDGTAQPENP
jgi:hypothetical protein